MNPMPAGWAPATTDLITTRPDLAGVGITDALEAVTSC